MAERVVTNQNGQGFSLKLLVSGLAASLMMGMWEMIMEGFILPEGDGFWSPVIYQAAFILRNLQTLTPPIDFQLIPVVVGLLLHMMFSGMLGLVFALLIGPRFSSLPGHILAGIVYSIVIYLVVWYIVLPILDPVMLNLNATVFLVGHVIWGITAGLVYHWLTDQERMPATPKPAY